MSSAHTDRDAFLEAAEFVSLLTGQPLTARHHIVAQILAAGGTATRRRIVRTVPPQLGPNTVICAVARMRAEGVLVTVAHGRYTLAGLEDVRASGPNAATLLGGASRGGGLSFSARAAGAGRE